MTRSDRNWWNGPLPWLAYLPFFFMPWLWVRPTAGQIVLTLVGVAIFMPAYLYGSRQRGARLLAAAALVLAVGIALMPANGAWTVFPIYASAMAGQYRPPRHAALAICVIAVATPITGLLAGQQILWWLPGLLLVILTGGATISREAFYDRTVALLASQEEVRRLAGTAERERITRDLHDVVGRTLTLVALKSDLAVRLIGRDAAAAEAEMRGVGEAARSGLAEVRAALAGQIGGSLAHEAAASAAALEAAGVTSSLAGEPAAIAADAGAVLAMILREAVTNVIRHADAGHCAIEVAMAKGSARLVVADDGKGGSFREGHGLSGMRQRVAAAGGTLQLLGDAPGTRLIATVPT